MWKNSLSGWEADAGVNATLIRRRQAYADAVKFYEQWLQKMHNQWDGKVKQTLVLQPLQRTLPVAAYLLCLMGSLLARCSDVCCNVLIYDTICLSNTKYTK